MIIHSSNFSKLSRLKTVRSFTSEILTFISRHVTGFPTDTLLVGTLNTSANVSRNHRKSKETSIGSIHVLQMWVHMCLSVYLRLDSILDLNAKAFT